MNNSILNNLKNEDLLEFMQYIVGCEYVSDLRTEDYNERAKRLLEKLDCSQYSFDSIEDAIEYLSKTQLDLNNND